ncbi:unnamed protein product [Blumeria hordei]|uniref:Uncharacterized protein n=1 Tax=Blumeria hordei TaxID=2867405 RepID=A0A383V2V3_BLUHO|nr:unnamed protein product [Blumeria hordei]
MNKAIFNINSSRMIITLIRKSTTPISSKNPPYYLSGCKITTIKLKISKWNSEIFKQVVTTVIGIEFIKSILIRIQFLPSNSINGKTNTKHTSISAKINNLSSSRTKLRQVLPKWNGFPEFYFTR